MAEFAIKGLLYSAREVLGYDESLAPPLFPTGFSQIQAKPGQLTRRINEIICKVRGFTDIQVEQKNFCEPGSMELTRKALHLNT